MRGDGKLGFPEVGKFLFFSTLFWLVRAIPAANFDENKLEPVAKLAISDYICLTIKTNV